MTQESTQKSNAEKELQSFALRRMELYTKQLELKREVTDIKIKMQDLATKHNLSLRDVITCW